MNPAYDCCFNCKSCEIEERKIQGMEFPFKYYKCVCPDNPPYSEQYMDNPYGKCKKYERK